MTLSVTFNKTLPKASKKTTSHLDQHGLVVLVDDNNQPLGVDHKAMSPYQSRINQLISQTNFKGKLAESVSDFAIGADAKKTPLALTLVGIGNQDKLTTGALQKVATAIYQATHKRLTTLHLTLSDALTPSQAKAFILSLLNADYRFDHYKSETSESPLQNVALIGSDLTPSDLTFMQAVHQGQSLARDVANEPGNVCYPEYMAQQAIKLGEQYADVLKVTVLGEAQMQALGMNCFLAVAKGSAREGKLVIMEYQGKSKFGVNSETPYAKELYDVDARTDDSPIILVGKGVTFDSGGISIKPGAAMDEMKFDMGGSASVLGTIRALCEARLPINVVGALACAENMPSGDATRPGDIVRAMNGNTVEILNTDAEGRLVLADTLCYVQRYNPRAIIDVATLTGACVIALGHIRSAAYSNDEDVLFELENAGEQSGDLIWHMPLDEAYQGQLDSQIADMQNIGGRAAGSITAACFLSRFVQEGQPWAHLDIAGTAWKSGKEKMGTGRPVPLFMQYLSNVSGHLSSAKSKPSKKSKKASTKK